jgi:hypothetical protein
MDQWIRGRESNLPANGGRKLSPDFNRNRGPPRGEGTRVPVGSRVHHARARARARAVSTDAEGEGKRMEVISGERLHP